MNRVKLAILAIFTLASAPIFATESTCECWISDEDDLPGPMFLCINIQTEGLFAVLTFSDRSPRWVMDDPAIRMAPGRIVTWRYRIGIHERKVEQRHGDILDDIHTHHRMLLAVAHNLPFSFQWGFSVGSPSESKLHIFKNCHNRTLAAEFDQQIVQIHEKLYLSEDDLALVTYYRENFIEIEFGP